MIIFQIIPSASKARAVFDSMKTTPYHIDSIVACTQSTSSSASFKLIVKRDGGNKRYDFEAESSKLACELVVLHVFASIDLLLHFWFFVQLRLLTVLMT